MKILRAITIILFACSASPLGICAVSSQGADSAYLFVGNMRDGSETVRVRQVIRRPQVADSAPSVSWADLASRIFWPGGAGQIFSISDPKFPTSIVSMKAQDKGEFAAGDMKCRSIIFSISGSMGPPDAGDAQPAVNPVAVRALSISGEADALICNGEEMPRAATMHIMRRVLPALWEASAVDEEVVSEIEVAWAKAP